MTNNSYREISFKLAAGIIFFPMIFSWVTLKEGYSKESRISAFSWLTILVLLSFVSNFTENQSFQKQEQAKLTHIKEIKNQDSEFFHKNKQQILTEAENLFNKGKIFQSSQVLSKYQNTNDVELNKLKLTIQAKLEKFQTEALSIRNSPLPYDKWEIWGYPETLEGTNNKYWLAYLPNIDISFLSKKSNDVVLFSGNSKTAAKSYLNNFMQERKKLIESQFSAWDGSHINLNRILKTSLHDPDSFDHVKTRYWDYDTFIIIQTKYRANNAFGTKVLGSIKAKADLNGNIIEIIAQN